MSSIDVMSFLRREAPAGETRRSILTLCFLGNKADSQLAVRDATKFLQCIRQKIYVSMHTCQTQ
jgi:hypothetical protein